MVRYEVMASRPYPVIIGKGLLSEAGSLLKKYIPNRRAVVVTDDIVHSFYASKLCHSLEKSGISSQVYVFHHGENSKTMTTVTQVLDFLTNHQLTRSDILIALGGGITGDITGFVASIYLRGIRFIQIPTTLLAAVDASVGGKTGVNLPAGKNLVGSFWQPSCVLCDCDTFLTLPKLVIADGIAEALKTGLIDDAQLFYSLAKGLDKANVEEVVLQCVRIKSKFVQADEFDKGTRQLLNFGHTFGHAIERMSNYQISHGHAISIGMMLAARAAATLGFSQENCTSAIEQALVANDLPISTDCTEETLLSAILLDKKRDMDVISLVLPVRIGKCALHKIPITDLSAWIRAGLGKETVK